MSDTEPPPGPAANRVRLRLLRDPFLYGAAAFALVVCGPISHYLGSLGDEGILLHGATRLLGGEVPHRDFFEVVPPGGFLIVAAWMTIAGGDFGAARVLAVGTIALIAALTYAATALASGHLGARSRLRPASSRDSRSPSPTPAAPYCASPFSPSWSRCVVPAPDS